MGRGTGALERHGNGVDRQTHNHVLSISPPRARSSLEFTETSLNHLADMMKFAETFLNHFAASIPSCPFVPISTERVGKRGERRMAGDMRGQGKKCNKGDKGGKADKVTRVRTVTGVTG